MDTPQEVQVWFILPGIRREFVLAMKKKGMAQKQIAAMMGVTEPAISQYLKNKRGNFTVFNGTILDAIDRSADMLMQGRCDFREELQKTMKLIKKTRFICNVCHEHLDTEDDCEVCYV